MLPPKSRASWPPESTLVLGLARHLPVRCSISYSVQLHTDRIVDNVNGADNKSIKALHVRELHGRVVGLRVDYTDGTNTGERGISSGITKTFDLHKGDIIQIWYHGNDQHVLGLKFGTNTFEKKNGKREGEPRFRCRCSEGC